MLIGPDRRPHVKVDGGRPVALDSCEIVRDLDHSVLTGAVRQGRAYRFPVGSRVTLLCETGVLFEGRAVAEDQVLDLMSSEDDEQLPGEAGVETI
jgi:hypothetical protein